MSVDHVHDFSESRRERAPTGPDPEHTEFFVMICPCGVVRVFPLSNFRLTTEEWKTKFLSDLFACGLTLEVE